MILVKFLAFVSFYLTLLFLNGVSIEAKENLDFTKAFQKCREIKNNVPIKIASDNVNNLFIFDLNGKIRALDKNQTEIWSLEIGGELTREPVFINESIFVLSRQIEVNEQGKLNILDKISSYYITSVDTFSGLSRWKKDFSSKNKPYVKVFGNKTYVLTDDENSSILTALDFSNGKVISERRLDFRLSNFYASVEPFILGKSNDSFVLLSISTGEVKLINNYEGEIETAVLNGEEIIFSDNKGNLFYTNDLNNVRKSKIKFGAKITFIFLFQDRLLLASNDNFLYSLSADGKKNYWKKRLAGRITTSPIILNNTVITYSQGGNSLYFMDFENGKIINRIEADQEIINEPLILDDSVVVQTSAGFSLYSTIKCEASTAAKK